MGFFGNLDMAVDTRQFLEMEKMDENTNALRKEIRALASGQSNGSSAGDREIAQAVQGLSGDLCNLGHDMDHVAAKIGELQVSVIQGMAGLGALFDWHMNSVISLLEQQQTELSAIQKLLRHPRKTEAQEDRDDAYKSWRYAISQTVPGEAEREWSLNQAMGYYKTAAEKDPFDYTTHLGLGMVLLQGMNQPEAALPHFEKAARTAQFAKDDTFESKAHFFAGRTLNLLGQNEKAYEETQRALELDPGTTVKIYECARYCALTGRTNECIQHIESLLRTKAIGGNVAQPDAEAWWTKIQNDSDFDAVRNFLEG